MKYTPKSPAVLVLQDGTVFYGKSAGKVGTATGEICFNTGMTGYQEVFTDPSYKGQLLLATNVHIGNYGITDEESESNSIKIAGLICRNFSQHHSRKQADASLTDYFIEQNIVAICEIDTRALVRHIRNKGAMNGIISSESLDVDVLKKTLSDVPSMEGLELSSTVSTKEPYEEMSAWEPDGFLVSNGPGDPAVMPNVVQIVKDIIAHDKPVFGICLGHQLISEACGISTFKMFNGHRGINHPVKNMVTGHSEVTSQNHGFSIGFKDVDKSDVVEITHVNLNDHSVEGIRVKNKKAFSVQYHPESAPGPDDSRYLFDEFVGLLKVGKMADVEM